MTNNVTTVETVSWYISFQIRWYTQSTGAK